MSQDYFLKRTYDAVYKANKAKSPFRSLSESYSLVYEQEPVTHEGFGKMPVEPAASEGVIEEPVVSGENIHWNKDKKYLTFVKWADLQAELYKREDITGIGPGEYSVASVVSGSEDISVLRSMISGQSKSYDVSYPREDATNAIRFEVKMEGDVRVGVKGMEVGKKVLTTVESALNHIIDEYEFLGEEDKKVLNYEILKNIDFGSLPEPVLYKRRGPGRVPGQETSQSIEAREEYKKKEAKKIGWDIYEYARAILDNIGELPLGLLFGKNYSYTYREEVETDIIVRRNKYLIASLLSVLKAIENVHSAININKNEREEGDPENVQAVKNTLQRYYGVKTGDKSEELNKAIDIEAHKVDRALTLKKIKTTGKGGSTYSEFVKAIKKLKFVDKIEDLEKMLKDGKTVRSLFPFKQEKIDGLFVVSSKGWKYVPADSIQDCVIISTITQGKPKIVLKKHPKNET